MRHLVTVEQTGWNRRRPAGRRAVLLLAAGWLAGAATAWAAPDLAASIRAVGSRAPGTPGNLAIEAAVAARFAGSGYTNGEIRFDAPVFVPGETTARLPDGQEYRLLPMHATLMRAGNFTERAFQAPLVYLGRGTHADLALARGQDLAGALAVMEFDCGDRWLHLLRFGLRGIIFLAAETYRPADAYGKVFNSEVSVPRFFAAEPTAGVFRAACRGATAPVLAEVRAEPSGWRTGTLRNPWVLIPGNDEELSREVVVITAPIDANSVVPELATDEAATVNLRILDDMLKAWGTAPPKRSVLLVAANAHTQYYLGERVLAWHLLAPAGDVTQIRDALARSIRLDRMIAEHYARLRFAPCDLRVEEANAAVDILWALQKDDTNASLQEDTPLKAEVARGALEHALHAAKESQKGWLSRMATDKSVAVGLAAEVAFLDAMRSWDDARLVGLLERARPVFADERIFEEWRSKLDTTTGSRVAIKSRLQERVKRELNLVKMELMELSSAVDKSQADRSVVDAARKERLEEVKRLSHVLVLFNKIDVGIGSQRTRYRHIAANPHERESLKEFRDELLGVMRRDTGEWQRVLDLDIANNALRAAMGARRVILVISMALEGPDGPVGFCSLSPGASHEWLRGLGTVAAEVAAARRAPMFVDALSGTGGQTQDHFFPSALASPSGVFHAAGGISAVALKRVFRPPTGSFIPHRVSEGASGDDVVGSREWLPGFLGDLVNEPRLGKDEICSPFQGQRAPFWSCVVRAYEMDEFSSKPTPSLAVSNALVVAYSGQAAVGVLPTIIDGDVVNAAMGRSDASGLTVLYGLMEARLAPQAYQIAEDGATALSTIDKGQIQQSMQMDSNLFRGESKILPMFPCREYVLYDRIDPSLVGSQPVSIREVWPISAVSGAEPRKYGTHGISSLSKASSHLSTGPVGVYLQRKREGFVQESMALLTGERRFVVNPTSKKPEGEGYTNGAALGPDFFARAAFDMDRVCRHRVTQMKGVVNELVTEFMDAGRAFLDEMQNAAAAFDHNRRLGAAALALGNETKAYEQIRGMKADMLNAIIVYMALMVPFCYFLQRLIFTFNRIEHEIFAFLGLFVLTYTGFRFIHPAFAIALSAEAIFIAFILGAIGCFVTWILHARFSEEMDLLFRGMVGFGGGGAAAGFVGQTAMLIGVNNMKRRRTRTTLTTATVVLVVFTMLAFSSVSRKVRPTLVHLGETAPYTGLFYTWPGLDSMDEATAHTVETLFGDGADLLVRRALFADRFNPTVPTSWRIERADHPEHRAQVDTALSLSAAESHFVGSVAFLHGGPFSSDGAMEIALPATLAEALNLEARDIGTARLRLLGKELKLVGILDDDRYRRMRDLDPDTPLFARPDVAATDNSTGSRAGSEGGTGHDLSGVVFLPPEVAKGLGARPYSVSIRLGGEDMGVDPSQPWRAADAFLRMAMPRFVLGSAQPFKVGDEAKRMTDAGVYFVSGSYRTSIGGLSRLVIPLLIAGLILFNTMLGTVYERKSEIAIYNAIGLNPHHIFIFFLAEALVYGVIGAIGGYLIGQILTLVAQSLDLVKGLNVNFSSLMVVWAILFTVALVLASTLYPAYVATRTAVPSGTRRWSLPPHDGQGMNVALPFIYQPGLISGVLVYLDEMLSSSSDASLGDLIVTPRGRSRSGGGGKAEFRIEYGMALAPFDLGVTQAALFEARFDPGVDSYVLNLQIRRESGQDTSWAMLNHPLLERIRGLLLRWRNMDPARREQYAKQGEAFFEG